LCIQTPPPHPSTTYTIRPNTASHPRAFTAYPPFTKDPTTLPGVRSFLIIAAFATANPPDTVIHLTTSASLKLIAEKWGSNKTARVTISRPLKTELDRRAGSASRAALRRMFGICSVAIGLRRLVVTSGLGAPFATAISGEERWSWIRNSETVKEMGKIWPSKMYVRTVDVSYLRVLAIHTSVPSLARVSNITYTFAPYRYSKTMSPESQLASTPRSAHL